MVKVHITIIQMGYVYVCLWMCVEVCGGVWRCVEVCEGV